MAVKHIICFVETHNLRTARVRINAKRLNDGDDNYNGTHDNKNEKEIMKTTCDIVI